MPDHTTITVPEGGTKRRTVRSGETFENTLIDITADGAHFDLDIRGRNWTVRNVGFKGKDDSPRKDQLINIQSSGDGLLDNIYLGDGQVDNGTHNTGVFVNKDSEGTITFRRVHVQGFADNGIYASACNHSDKPHGGATVVIEDSYGRNNNTANFRVSGDAVVRNTVSVCDGPVPVKSGQHHCRPIWVKELANVTVVGCDLESSHAHGGDCVTLQDNDGGQRRRVTVRNTQWGPDGKRYHIKHPDDRIDHRGNGNGTNPDTTPPAGVPMSAREAASGSSRAGGNGGDSPATPTIPTRPVDPTVPGYGDGAYGDGPFGSSVYKEVEIVIDGRGTGGTVRYEFAVPGQLRAGRYFDTDGTDRIDEDGAFARGTLGNGVDSYYAAVPERFAPPTILAHCEIESQGGDADAVSVFVDGEAVTPVSRPHIIAFDGHDLDSEGAFEWSVLFADGISATWTGESGATVDTPADGDVIGNETGRVFAWGRCRNGIDALRFSGRPGDALGSILGVQVSGSVGEIRVNDTPVDPSVFGTGGETGPALDPEWAALIDDLGLADEDPAELRARLTEEVSLPVGDAVRSVLGSDGRND